MPTQQQGTIIFLSMTQPSRPPKAFMNLNVTSELLTIFSLFIKVTSKKSVFSNGVMQSVPTHTPEQALCLGVVGQHKRTPCFLLVFCFVLVGYFLSYCFWVGGFVLFYFFLFKEERNLFMYKFKFNY